MKNGVVKVAFLLFVCCIIGTTILGIVSGVKAIVAHGETTSEVEEAVVKEQEQFDLVEEQIVKCISVVEEARMEKREIIKECNTSLAIEVSTYKEECEEEELHLMSVPSYSKIVAFNSPNTDEVYMIDIGRLKYIYDTAEEIGEWDVRNAYREIRVLHDFLIMQMGVNENIAFGIIGNIACEGAFGQEQKSYKVFESYEEAINKLGNNKVILGYGIVQWTVQERRDNLIKYYKAAHEIVSDNKEIQILAECVCLYEELSMYKLFNSYQEDISIETACGKVALEYERYSGSKKEWKALEDGTYKLVKSNCSGEKRLTYSKKLSEYFY